MCAIRRLRDAYQRCRTLNAEHGRTFFLATRLLAPQQRPAVHALYGFARRADDILDDFDAALPTAERAERLQRLATQLFNRLVGHDGADDDPALRAVVHTARRYGIPWELFDDFLGSMRMDLTVTDYPDRAALDRYMHGSAEVIGLQMLPVLGTVGPREEAAPYAAALGKAFQLTNFLRDVDEDLQRGRVYLPADELAAHGVDRDVLMWCQTHRRTDARVRRALADQHAATRRVYEYRPPRHRCSRRGRGRASPRRSRCTRRSWTASRASTSRSSASARRSAPRDACRSPAPDWSRPGARANQQELIVDHWQYLIVLGACLLITAPLETVR